MMVSRSLSTACVALVLLAVALLLQSTSSPAASVKPQGMPIELAPEGALSPEDAATSLYYACCMKSPRHFVRNLALGVCDGPIGTLNKYAELLHTMTFSDGTNSFTVYELPMRMKRETIRLVASRRFSEESVSSLRPEFVSSYYCSGPIMCVEVVADNYDGGEYRTRIVVTENSGRWYAIPRCRSSKRFYQIADAMPLAASDSELSQDARQAPIAR